MLEFHATLRVWTHGYRWEPGPFFPSYYSYLAPGRTCDVSAESLRELDANYREYEPFRHNPAIFLEFANLGHDADSIRAFADRYGELEVDFSFVSDGRTSLLAYSKANSLDEWVGAIDDVSRAVELWRQIQTTKVDPSELDATIKERLALAASISPMRVAGQLVLQVELDSLIHVIWAQFATAVSNQLQFRNCQSCARPFKLTDENRSDRQFCSDACRSKSYRRRKSAAMRMRSEGRKLREIAKELGTDLKTLKRWLGE